MTDNNPDAQALEALARNVAKTREGVFALSVDFLQTYAVAFETKSVQKGLELFFGLEDLETFNEELKAAKDAYRSWTEASQELLAAVGGRR